MENAQAIALIIGPIYALFGLSMLIYASQWQKVIKGWTKDHFSLIPLIMFSMVLGLIIIHTYNVWTWHIWLLVTISGWAMFLKGAAYLLLPGSVLKAIISMKQNLGMIYLGGLIGTLAGGVLTYYSYFA